MSTSFNANQTWQNASDQERANVIASIPTREQLEPAIQAQVGSTLDAMEQQQQSDTQQQQLYTQQQGQTYQQGNPQDQLAQAQYAAQLQAQQNEQQTLLQQQQQQQLEEERQKQAQAQAQIQQKKDEEDNKNWFERNWDWLLGVLAAVGIAIFAWIKIKKYKDETKATQATNSELGEKISDLKEKVNNLKDGSNNNSGNTENKNNDGSTLANNSSVYTQETVDQINSLLSGKDRI